MRTSPPALVPLLRSQVQGDLLALLYLHPDREYSVSEAAAEIGATVKAVHHEVSRMVPADLVRDRRRGRLRLIRAATDTVLTRPLTDLLAVTYGPRHVLSDLLTDLTGVDEAYIYGSWAARYLGEPGAIPADVDVLVIGTVSLDDLDSVALAAGRRLGRPVNIRRVRPDIWADPHPDDPFLASVRTRPLVRVDGQHEVVMGESP